MSSGFVKTDAAKISKGDPTCPHCHLEDQTVDHHRCPTYHLHRFQTAILLGISIFTSVQNISKYKTGLSVYIGIMRCLREAVRLKRPERWQNNDWILHVGNARPHTAHVVLQFLAKHSTIQIPHPPYSPDLAPNDFFLYPKLKMNLKGRKFDNVDMIQAESKATLRNLSKSDFISCFDNWKKRWNGCIEAGGAYFEKY
ncbi:hypothetical protein LAZ67_3002803 [Cordylochernes scorpioides]|uniref:Transposase n=1 Tax=Cordylochernes scorpioides TaxID=51811 RepID=A0ABY6KAX2_9ARAC|nr:hypothetical protein LAZ67_3002803 [Cordylochernes scorpioides]